MVGTGRGPRGRGDLPNVLATVRVPAASLPPGDYILTLSTTDGGPEAELHKYYFRVVTLIRSELTPAADPRSPGYPAVA